MCLGGYVYASKEYYPHKDFTEEIFRLYKQKEILKGESIGNYEFEDLEAWVKSIEKVDIEIKEKFIYEKLPMPIYVYDDHILMHVERHQIK